MTMGIENALVLDDIDVSSFRTYKKELDGYGGEKIIPEFKKMKCCEYICALDDENAKKVLTNLKTMLDQIIEVFKSN